MTKNFHHFISTGEFLFIRMAFTSQPDLLCHNAHPAHTAAAALALCRSSPKTANSRCHLLCGNVMQHVMSPNTGNLCCATFSLYTTNHRATSEQTITKQSHRRFKHYTTCMYLLSTSLLTAAHYSLANCWKPRKRCVALLCFV